MTEESKYLLKAVNALADARAYVGHVEQVMGAGTGEINEPVRGELQIVKSQIMRAYDRCVFLYGVAR